MEESARQQRAVKPADSPREKPVTGSTDTVTGIAGLTGFDGSVRFENNVDLWFTGKD